MTPNWLIDGHKPWGSPPFDILPTGPRKPIPFPGSVGAHVSIAHKMGIDPDTGAQVPVKVAYIPNTLGPELARNRVWIS